MREGELEIMVTRAGEDTPARVPFEAVFPSRDSITSLTLLWDASSYYINVTEQYFIICGGRRLHPELLDGFGPEMKVFLARRHQQDLDAGSMEQKEHRIFYCLGITDGENYLYVQISEDGRWWVWRDRR